MTLIPHESDAVRQLRYDIAILSQNLDGVEQQITAFQQAQYAFEREYQNRLGDLAEALVALRAQLGMQQSQHSFTPAITQLADDDYVQLKKAYRQAAKLCHPDYLSDKHRKIGWLLFDSLNKAYHLQDLVQVEMILWLLQTGQAFSDSPLVITHKALLIRRKNLLEQLITQRQDYLEALKRSESYDISNPDNWNILLYDYQTQLEDELAMLRGRITE